MVEIYIYINRVSHIINIIATIVRAISNRDLLLLLEKSKWLGAGA